jgi:hypothetical protein
MTQNEGPMKMLLMSTLVLAACGGSSALLREPDEYTGCATDEHWRTFDDQEPSAKVSDAMAPSVTAPTAGMLASATKPVFSWSQDPGDPGQAAGDVPHDGPGCNNCCPEWNLGALTTLHLPAISGDVYDLQFSTGGSVTHRVITTLQEWAPTDSLWSSWKQASVSLKIYRMTLINNDLPMFGAGGPFVASQPFRFTVGP